MGILSEVASGLLNTNSAQVNGTLTLDGGQINWVGPTGSINLAGTTNWTQGGFTGGNVDNTGTINVTGSAGHYVSENSTLVNQGQINLGAIISFGDQYGPGA